ncbi:hypothetical protein Emed_003940 [Eimeria media]
MQLKHLGASAAMLLAISSSAVLPSSAAEEGSGSESLSNELEAMISGVVESMLEGPMQELLIPSQHRLNLQRTTSKHLLQLAEKLFEASPEARDKMRLMMSRVSELEEERFVTYTAMQELKKRMDEGTFTTEEDAANRREMQQLIQKLKDLTKQVDLVPMEVGLPGQEDTAGLLGTPELKIVEETLNKVLYAPFNDYI